ncbi:hypothetical protein Acr_26g0004280 [Actinidia rufa]|uniref:Uncharacterized protein n=1 Tax=Actinidia rufa TaxID=165716 RepID=A0A7J0H2B3_9ERIC|nr:hypothetical protein Acr_26g0004280 [Actinidia rufa]
MDVPPRLSPVEIMDLNHLHSKVSWLHRPLEKSKSSVSKYKKKNVDDGAEKKNEDKMALKPPVTFLLSAISETGLVCRPSLSDNWAIAGKPQIVF